MRSSNTKPPCPVTQGYCDQPECEQECNYDRLYRATFADRLHDDLIRKQPWERDPAKREGNPR